MSRHAASLFGAILFVMAMQAAYAPPLMAYEAARSAYGAALHLPSFPARVRLLAPVPGVSHGGAEALARAMQTWSRVEGSPLHYEMAADGQAAMVEVEPISEGWKWGATIGAHTDVKSDARTGEIQYAHIELDASRKWSDAEEVPSDAIDLETVLLHELGHAAGLAHGWDPSAVMRAGIKPGQTPRRALTMDDANGIRALYGKIAAAKPQQRPSRLAYLAYLAFALGLGASTGLAWAWAKRRGRRASHAVVVVVGRGVDDSSFTSSFDAKRGEG